MEADLDLAMTASLCFALLAAVLPNRPGEGDRLLVLEMNIWAEDGQSAQSAQYQHLLPAAYLIMFYL